MFSAIFLIVLLWFCKILTLISKSWKILKAQCKTKWLWWIDCSLPCHHVRHTVLTVSQLQPPVITHLCSLLRPQSLTQTKDISTSQHQQWFTVRYNINGDHCGKKAFVVFLWTVTTSRSWYLTIWYRCCFAQSAKLHGPREEGEWSHLKSTSGASFLTWTQWKNNLRRLESWTVSETAL